MYLDSVSNDTLDMQAVVFGGNAPVAKTLVRYKVDMKNTTVNSKGVFAKVADNYLLMCPLNGVYHKISNGNLLGNIEIKDSSCNMPSASRNIVISNHKELDTVCYAQCKKCSPAASISLFENNEFTISPNPSNGHSKINSNQSIKKVIITNALGQQVFKIDNAFPKNQIDLPYLSNSGLYLISIYYSNNQLFTTKYIQY
jgi:hypothetical protein